MEMCGCIETARQQGIAEKFGVGFLCRFSCYKEAHKRNGKMLIGVISIDRIKFMLWMSM
jgi:hypothetical protein